MPYLLSLLIGGASSLLLAELSKALAPRLGLVDRAGGQPRKIHEGARAIGGIALFGGLLSGAGPFLHWSRAESSLILGSAVVLGLGLIDDLRGLGLGAKSRLVVQFLAALIPVGWGGLAVRSIALGGWGLVELGSWGLPLTLLWLVGVTNAINLLDGLDGLAIGCAAIILSALALFAWRAANSVALLLSLALLGSTLSFLRYNFYPARLFLGNEGAYSLGFLLGILALVAFQPEFGPITGLPPPGPILLLGLPLADTAFAIVRRLRERRSIFAPDRGHIHHRLLARWGYKPALWISYGISLALSLLVFALYWR
ncbi:MAG: MraY family glycosyltransferase [Candidatus Bipolaricaulia bacterium]